MGQPVVHFEVIGKDADKLQSYYGELFGWQFDADNPMKYGMVAREGNVNTEGIGIGGGVGGGMEGYDGHVTFYVEVPDIEAALQKYPRITYRADVHSLEVPAQTRNGFQVSIRQRADRYTLGFEKWHQEFTNATSAFDFFMFGLSRVCRLQVFSCGGVDYKWQVQRQFERRWITISESGMVLIPFWCKKSDRFLQNEIIDAA